MSSFWFRMPIWLVVCLVTTLWLIYPIILYFDQLLFRSSPAAMSPRYLWNSFMVAFTNRPGWRQAARGRPPPGQRKWKLPNDWDDPFPALLLWLRPLLPPSKPPFPSPKPSPNPVEPDLALQRSFLNLLRNLAMCKRFRPFPDFFRNFRTRLRNPIPSPELSSEILLRNPSEPDWPLHQTKPLNFSKTMMNLTWLCNKASYAFSGILSGSFSDTLSGTFSGTLLNLTFSGIFFPDLWNLFQNLTHPFSRTFSFPNFEGTWLSFTKSSSEPSFAPKKAQSSPDYFFRHQALEISPQFSLESYEHDIFRNLLNTTWLCTQTS